MVALKRSTENAEEEHIAPLAALLDDLPRLVKEEGEDPQGRMKIAIGVDAASMARKESARVVATLIGLYGEANSLGLAEEANELKGVIDRAKRLGAAMTPAPPDLTLRRR